MADDPPSSSNVNPDDQRLEDAETRATREELRHSHISDNGNSTTQAPLSILSNTRNQDGQGEDDDMKLRSGKEFNLPAPTSVQRKKTPDLSPPENLSRDNAGERKVSSPKKKRAHDEVETHKDSEGQGSNGTDSDGWVMVDEGDTNKSRSEPQKKRARDETSPPAELHQSIATVSLQSMVQCKAEMCVNLLPPDYFRCPQGRLLRQGQPTTTDLPLQIRRFWLRQASCFLFFAVRRDWSPEECFRRGVRSRAIAVRKLRRTSIHSSVDVNTTQPTEAQLWKQGCIRSIAFRCHEWRQTGNRRLRKWLWWREPLLKCAWWSRTKDWQFRFAWAASYY